MEITPETIKAAQESNLDVEYAKTLGWKFKSLRSGRLEVRDPEGEVRTLLQIPLRPESPFHRNR